MTDVPDNIDSANMASANMSSSKEIPQNKPPNATIFSLPLEIQQHILFHAMGGPPGEWHATFCGPSGELRLVCRAFRAALPAVERQWLHHHLKALRRERDTRIAGCDEMQRMMRNEPSLYTENTPQHVRTKHLRLLEFYHEVAYMEDIAKELEVHGKIMKPGKPYTRVGPIERTKSRMPLGMPSGRAADEGSGSSPTAITKAKVRRRGARA